MKIPGKDYKFVFLYRTLTQRVPKGTEDVVLINFRDRSSGRMPIRCLEGLFFCNKDPFDRRSEDRVVTRDYFPNFERQYDGEFVDF